MYARGLRSRFRFSGTKFFSRKKWEIPGPKHSKLVHFLSRLIPTIQDWPTSRPVSVPKMKREFPNFLNVVKTCQDIQ